MHQEVTGELDAPEKKISLETARRMALAAQGFTGRESSNPSARALSSVLKRLGLVQIDSVNRIVRAHYMPFFSRLGPYEKSAVDALFSGKRAHGIEYWAHEASIVDRELYGALRRITRRRWGMGVESQEEREAIKAPLLEVLASSGKALSAREVGQKLGVDTRKDRGHWGWNWAPVKHALMDLFQEGEIVSVGRNPHFEKLYRLRRDVLGEVDSMEETEALDQLSERAVRALGVAHLSSVADYFRLKQDDVRAALQRLQEQGKVCRVQVEGQTGLWWSVPNAPRAPRCGQDALVSPFDSLVFHRPRLRQLWDVEYSLEIYVPEEKRIYGYYVDLFLQGTRLTARVDLHCDRAAGVLHVHGAFAESCADGETPERLAAQLWRMARWLDVREVRVGTRGDLSERLRYAVSSHVD